MSFKSELKESSDSSIPELFFCLMASALSQNIVVALEMHTDSGNETVLQIKMQRVDCKPINIYSHFGHDFYTEYLYARDFLLGRDKNKKGKFIGDYFT